MELKQYQQAVLNDLAQYIDILKEQESNHKAFSTYWKQNGITLQSIHGNKWNGWCIHQQVSLLFIIQFIILKRKMEFTLWLTTIIIEECIGINLQER